MADGGLYVHDREKNTTQSLDDGYLVVRHPMQRVAITHAILRYDTDDKKIIWLELHMNELSGNQTLKIGLQRSLMRIIPVVEGEL